MNRTKKPAKPRANERWLCAVFELDINTKVIVSEPASDTARREAEKIGEVKKQLRAFAKVYKRRVKRFDLVPSDASGCQRVVAVFDSRMPAVGVQSRPYRPNKDRTHAIEVSWARKSVARRNGGAN